MRIIGGARRGQPLSAPSHRLTRPTSGVVREAIFDILSARIAGSRVLDLFAGSGALGLEALSRGAVQGCFVDRSPAACAIIRLNAQTLHFQHVSHVVCGAAPPVFRQLDDEYDLVFIDPPYAFREWCRLLEELGRSGIFAQDGMAVLEYAAREQPPEIPITFSTVRQRSYGDTGIAIVRASTRS
ncbi:MAG: 16S rRNA (guanine(966)-N(2))-methyltransferase RsmD [Chloroflexi bacterium]|nr:16S rRNA (guanine(966)-N(2))-methyltransferase RsmD [Chloroflexota bacterium]